MCNRAAAGIWVISTDQMCHVWALDALLNVRILQTSLSLERQLLSFVKPTCAS